MGKMIHELEDWSIKLPKLENKEKRIENKKQSTNVKGI